MFEKGGVKAIQIASDLHLGSSTEPFSHILTPSAPILILAGDIAPLQSPQYESFLTWCSRNWKYVLLTTGNHEYYCESVRQNMPDCDRAILMFLTSKLPNVHYLQGGASIVLEGIRFIGATLWSRIDSALWSDPKFLQRGDYTHIFLQGQPVTPSDISAIHAHQKARLASAIASANDPIVVITHHLPTHNLVPTEYRTSAAVSAYATNCEELMVGKVKAWICGHSHEAAEWRAPSGTLCVLNPRGYAGQISGFSPRKILNIQKNALYS